MVSSLGKDFLKPWGIGRLMAVMLDKRGGERLGLILPGPADRDLSVLKRGLRVLAPHIQRAMRISDRLATLQLAEGAAKTAADQSPFGVISLDHQFTVMAANSRVMAYERAGIVRLTGGRLTFVHPSSQAKLIEFSKMPAPSGLAFQALADNGSECPVLAAKVDPQSVLQIGGISTGASMIITLGSGPGETPVVEINRVGQWYGLTPSEARLTVSLASGMSLQDYAAERATSINAVRFLLKGVFRKTATTSQAQLTATLARLPVD
jgi:DNA-binding CsgD family transcriptional regulator